MCGQNMGNVFITLMICFSHIVYGYKMAVPFYNSDGNILKKIFYKDAIIQPKCKTCSDTESYLINTPGCYIPNYALKYKYKDGGLYELHREYPCGVRAVFVDYVAINRIRFRIDRDKMKQYTSKAKYKCCFKFIYKLIMKADGKYTTNLIFSKCSKFKTGTTVDLDHEIISVSCIQYNKKKEKEIYNDAYIIIKKLDDIERNTNSEWNVLVLGVHSMSRARLADTMPYTFRYLKNHKWLDYKGYQKVGSNTFPNIMALLTGRNNTNIRTNCEFGLHKCADYFLWEKYKASGYVTAYGEDYFNLPNTFTKFGGFITNPTDHYMQQFFELGERRLKKIMCMRRRPSATHLLRYAHYFANTYINNKFFGMFWINSYSHNPTDNPSILDQELASWFVKLNTTGVLKNTFVMFLSDHGTRYGEMKIPIESYYDERLPILFLWAPYKFRKEYSRQYINLYSNQRHLITPYDVYTTLGHILKLSNDSTIDITSNACPNCSSLLNSKPQRWTCLQARVSENGCSCRILEAINISAVETQRSIELAVAFINNVSVVVETIPCMSCKRLQLKKVIRSHTFHKDSRLYNVVAFEMSHSVSFEATIVKRLERSRILDLHTITAFNKNGSCVLDQSDRPYCECEVTDCEVNSPLLYTSTLLTTEAK